MNGFYASLGKGTTLLPEGGTNYEIHQINVLDLVERWLLYSVAQYRRSLDMLAPISAPWAHVTLYYSSFFAANAILGMFGAWIGHVHGQTWVVDVESKAIGSQVLRVNRKLRSPGRLYGSHKVFWDFFYAGTSVISSWSPAKLVGALSPVNGDVEWQTNQRNQVNYDMFEAWNASMRFHNTFRNAKLSSLSGPLLQQFETTEGLMKLGLHFATDFGILTTALDGCGATGTRLQIRRRLVKQSIPSLVTQSALDVLLEA